MHRSASTAWLSVKASLSVDGAVELIVTPGKHHEMDIPQLLKFLGDGS